MLTAELTNYVKKELDRGVKKDDLKKVLLSAGWNASDIDEAINESSKSVNYDFETSLPSKDNHVIVSQGEKGEVKKPKRFKKWLIAGFILLLILALGSGVGGYFYYYSPEQVMGRAVNNLAKVETYEYKGSVALHIEFPESVVEGSGEYGEILSLFLSDYSANFWGEADNREKENTKAVINLDLKMGGGSLGEVEIRTIGDIVYLNLKSVNPVFGSGFDSFLERWIKVDPEALSEEYGVDLSEELDKKEPIPREMTQEFIEFVKENPPYDNLQKVGEDEIEGVETYHFTLSPNQENLVKVFEKAEELFGRSYGIEENSYKDSVSSTEISDIDIWVGKRDSQIYRVKFFVETQTDNQDIQQDIPEISVDFDLNLFNHNSDIVIEEPLSPTGIENLLEDLQPATPSGEIDLPSDELEIEGLLQVYLKRKELNLPEVSGVDDQKTQDMY